jgi:hypothetical protein
VASTALIVVEGAGEQVVDAVVAREWPVTGWVRDELGRPMAGAKVRGPLQVSPTVAFIQRPIRNPPGRRHLEWDDSSVDGSFRLLASGRRVAVEATAPDGGELFGDFEDGGERVSTGGEHRVVRPARGGPVAVTVRRASSVAGTVRDGRGAGVPGVLVIAAPALDVSWVKDVVATTDAQGRFALVALPPGDLELIARFEWRPFQAATRVRLHPGESRDGVEIVVPR